MSGDESLLKGKHILAVDDEEDILETIAELLDESDIDTARDYESASQKIKKGRYDLAILDIMGVDGLKLLEEAVDRGIPTVMGGPHAWAVAEESELDELLDSILGAYHRGEPPWKLLFEKLGDYFDRRFGPDWKEKDREFWSEFSRNYSIGKGIQERLKHDKNIRDKGI